MTDPLPDWKNLTADERISIITPLWDENKSASQIAAYFVGASRNSIIGAVHRAKLPARPKKAPVMVVPKPKRLKPPKVKPKPMPRARKPIPSQPGTPPMFSALPDQDMPSESVMHMIENNRPPLAGTTPLDILSLPNRPSVLCRFPVTGGYCGASSGDRMYCKEHHAVMYRPTEHKIRMPKEARR